MNELEDRFGRRFSYLRLSLTEACNYRCSYCLPDGYDGPSRGFLTRPEIGRVLRAFVDLGMTKLRLTGGEPSLRRDLIEIIDDAANLDGIRKIAMTTNGVVLERKVSAWRDAGLTALNVSLDSLDPDRFAAVTGFDHHASLLRGIDQALTLGFDSVKLNAVLLRGVNDDELDGWLDYVRVRALSMRFIELMRTGDNADYFAAHHLPASTVAAQLLARGWTRVARAPDAGPAIEYAHPDYRGKIGLIAPYAPNFCASCNRLRVTARGDLRLCLFGEFGVPLRGLLQDDADGETLRARIAQQLGLKAAGHDLHRGNPGMTPHLASVGG